MFKTKIYADLTNECRVNVVVAILIHQIFRMLLNVLFQGSKSMNSMLQGWTPHSIFVAYHSNKFILAFRLFWMRSTQPELAPELELVNSHLAF